MNLELMYLNVYLLLVDYTYSRTLKLGLDDVKKDHDNTETIKINEPYITIIHYCHSSSQLARVDQIQQRTMLTLECASLSTPPTRLRRKFVRKFTDEGKQNAKRVGTV